MLLYTFQFYKAQRALPKGRPKGRPKGLTKGPFILAQAPLKYPSNSPDIWFSSV